MNRILVLLVILGLAAGGYLAYQNKDRFKPTPEAKEVAPHRWQVNTPTARTENASQEVLNATNATQILSEGNATSDANATTAENATSEENATRAVPPSDAIVTHGFIHDLAAYLVSNYFPADTKRNPSAQGRFDLNVKSLNIRYGVDFPGMAVDVTDVLGSRKRIFDHVLTAPVLDFMHAAYTPLFLDALEQALVQATYTQTSENEGSITDAQRKEMLGLLAAKLRVVGQIVTTLATSDTIHPLVEKYLEDMDKVSTAHMKFWDLQASGSASPAAQNEASTRIKTAIQTREVSRQRLLQAIATTVNPQGMDASELIYLAQWVHRRGQEDPNRLPLVAKTGELLNKTATAVEERSRQPRPEVTPMDPGGVQAAQ